MMSAILGFLLAGVNFMVGLYSLHTGSGDWWLSFSAAFFCALMGFAMLHR